MGVKGEEMLGAQQREDGEPEWCGSWGLLICTRWTTAARACKARPLRRLRASWKKGLTRTSCLAGYLKGKLSYFTEYFRGLSGSQDIFRERSGQRFLGWQLSKCYVSPRWKKAEGFPPLTSNQMRRFQRTTPEAYPEPTAFGWHS